MLYYHETLNTQHFSVFYIYMDIYRGTSRKKKQQIPTNIIVPGYDNAISCNHTIIVI